MAYKKSSNIPIIGKKLELIYKLRGEPVTSAIQELTALEKTDSQSLIFYKEKKLEALFSFVKENCDYYKNIFGKQKLKLTGTSPFKILQEMPIMDNQTIRSSPSSFTCGKIRSSSRSTSGTTGTPFIFKKDRYASGYMDAMMFSVYQWHGITPLSPQARVWGRPSSFKGQLLQNAKDYLVNRRRLSAFEMSDKNCRKFFELLKKHQPKYFYAYPSALLQLALSLERQGINGEDIGVSAAICTGEVLFPHHRKKIEQVFGCKTVNEYGSTENGIIGFECEYGNLHLMPTVHVEIINPAPDGFGEIAVTELNSRSMPFIKYKNGDLGRIVNSPCQCKRPFERIEIKEGRIDDFILCPNGNVVYDAILAYTLKDYVLKFKAFQEKEDLINIQIVPNKAYNKVSEKDVRNSLKSYLGPEMRVNFTVVDTIPSEKSGKLRYFVSKIK